MGTDDPMVSFEQLFPLSIPYLGSEVGGADDVGEQDGGEEALLALGALGHTDVVSASLRLEAMEGRWTPPVRSSA